MRWEYSRLEEIVEFRNGVNFTSASFGSGIKVINVADFKDRMYPDYQSLGELDSEAHWSKQCFLKENDIVFVRSNGNKNLIGRSVFIKNLPKDIQVTYSAFCIRLRFKNLKNISPEFYLYLFKSPLFRGILSQFGNGTNISNLNQDILNNMVIPRPSLVEQRKISSILSAYDELIENNKQRIKLLEEMAEEIYKEWFVRLRFPGYETAKFIDGLPAGWKNSEMENFVEVSDGTHDSPKSSIDGFHLVTGKNIKNGFIDLKDTYLISKEDYSKIQKRSHLSPGDIIVSNIGTIGSTAMIFEEPNYSVKNVIIVRPQKASASNYVYTFLKSNSTQLIFQNEMSGASQQFLSLSYMRSFKIIVPSHMVLSKFEKIAGEFYYLKNLLYLKNQLLQQTRDLLLPRLISGKLSVEHLVEEEDRLSVAAEPEVNYQAIK